MKLDIRPGAPSDFPLILDSFVNTYLDAPQAQGASGTTLASLLEPLLQSSAWHVAVAASPDDPDTILGFIIYEPRRKADQPNPVVAWIQVRGPWKRRGVARALLTHAGVNLDGGERDLWTPFMVARVGTDERSPALTELAKKHGVTLRWRPYLPLELQRQQVMASLVGP